MRSFSVVVLSNEPARLKACIEALRRSEPALPVDRIIIVAGGQVYRDTRFAGMPTVVPQSEDRFNFSREVNRGLQVAGAGADVLVLGDDVRLQTPGLVSKLAEIAEASGGKCILSPAYTGRIALYMTDGGEAWAARFKPAATSALRYLQMVPFFAAYLPAETRRIVGDLDERYTDYGSEDDDYCHRARLEGISVAVVPNLVAEHGSGEGRAGHMARWGKDRFGPGGVINHAKLIEKWGSYPPPEIPYDAPVSTARPWSNWTPPPRCYGVFVVSGSAKNFKRLLDSVERFEPSPRGVVPIVFASWEPGEVPGAGVNYLHRPQIKPFIVTREYNRGLAELWGKGVDALMVEDDIELTEPTFEALSKAASAYQGRCIVQPAIDGFRYGNVVTTPSPHYRVRIEPKHYPLICVYFPREVEYYVGYYDEGFTSYGGDDNDYSLRCQQAGVLQLCLPWLKARHHYGSSVFLRKERRDLGPSRRYFESKWGHRP